MTRYPGVRAIAGAAALMLAQPAPAAEVYVFDPAHTYVHIEWSHFGFSTTSAEFEEVRGQLMLDEQRIPDSEVSVTIDLASVDSGFETFNRHLTERPEWFHVEEHPEATFESTNIEAIAEHRYKVTGELTLKGVTREVTLDTRINRIGQHPVSKVRTLGFDATAVVSRSAFDMGKYAPGVGDEVTIRISAEMQRRSEL